MAASFRTGQGESVAGQKNALVDFDFTGQIPAATSKPHMLRMSRHLFRCGLCWLYKVVPGHDRVAYCRVFAKHSPALNSNRMAARLKK